MVKEGRIMGWVIVGLIVGWGILVLLFNYGAHMDDEDD